MHAYQYPGDPVHHQHLRHPADALTIVFRGWRRRSVHGEGTTGWEQGISPHERGHKASHLTP